MNDLNSYEYRCFWDETVINDVIFDFKERPVAIVTLDISNLNDNFGV